MASCTVVQYYDYKTCAVSNSSFRALESFRVLTVATLNDLSRTPWYEIQPSVVVDHVGLKGLIKSNILI
jgi:hypothetical protein